MAGKEGVQNKHYPRDPALERYYQQHLRLQRARDRFSVQLKVPSFIYGAANDRYLGVGADLNIPLVWAKKINLGVGYLWHEFGAFQDSGHRFSLYLDLPYLSCTTKLRAGVYVSLPDFAAVAEELTKIEGGVYTEVLLSLLRLGPADLGVSFLAGLGTSAEDYGVLLGASGYLGFDF